AGALLPPPMRRKTNLLASFDSILPASGGPFSWVRLRTSLTKYARPATESGCMPFLVTSHLNAPSDSRARVMLVSAAGAAFYLPARSEGGGGGTSSGAVEADAPGAGTVPGSDAFGTLAVVATNGFPSVVVGCAPATAVGASAGGAVASSLALANVFANDAE